MPEQLIKEQDYESDSFQLEGIHYQVKRMSTDEVMAFNEDYTNMTRFYAPEIRSYFAEKAPVVFAATRRVLYMTGRYYESSYTISPLSRQDLGYSVPERVLNRIETGDDAFLSGSMPTESSAVVLGYQLGPHLNVGEDPPSRIQWALGRRIYPVQRLPWHLTDANRFLACAELAIILPDDEFRAGVDQGELEFVGVYITDPVYRRSLKDGQNLVR